MSGYVARMRQDGPPGSSAEFDLLVGSAARRWAAVDPLLPEPSHPRLSGYPLLTVSDEHGRPAALGTMRYSWYQPGEAGRTWGVPDQHWLTPLVGGPDPEGALDSLLTSWRDQLEQLPSGTGSESAAQLTWPARDVCGVRPLQRHGMQPITVLAARRQRRGVPPSLPPRDVTMRLADIHDLAVVVGLIMEEHRYEESFGGVFVQPETPEQTRRVVARALSRPPSWVWLAERRGRPVGLLWVSPPERARWAAPLVNAAPAAYVGYAVVAEEERGRGIGTALVSQAHQAMDSHGIAVTLLNYSVMNPLSGPFWHRMGYRPLWTTWEIRPALALR
ncbi:GNAT family N-acetyltransferase [Marinitenerispora sediminis]|uniref:GNAT family N-acetyltransferase n=1 Tax=Marinitenerispora sediminis TaxID=1931232 RepID=A0A368TA16_9ACTN|nr:GNAT family N-acetyltransferase [Marinitenerispora sediminis]RCV51664.1 GNAT family N-acetyltransferase [Marinitenerispora sediminis]RCV59462.1 GNAT family N-acetyltransferase [Marinitenerispora sediminis]RCV61699.1 GNAT family N-acetyltransferase [Marinitenerispora sediminis]